METLFGILWVAVIIVLGYSVMVDVRLYKKVKKENKDLATALSCIDKNLRAFKDETELRLARLEHTPKFKVGDIVVIETQITGAVSAIITKCFYAGKLDLLLTYSCKVENGNTVDLYEYQLRPYVKPAETKKKDKK